MFDIISREKSSMSDLAYSVVPAWSRYVEPMECSQSLSTHEEVCIIITMKHWVFSFLKRIELFMVIPENKFCLRARLPWHEIIHGGHLDECPPSFRSMQDGVYIGTDEEKKRKGKRLVWLCVNNCQFSAIIIGGGRWELTLVLVSNFCLL